MEMPQEQLMMTCMDIISNAGEGRGLVHEGLEFALKKNYIAAQTKLDEAEKYLAEAHRLQFEELMGPQNKGMVVPFNMLLLHAMDLLMVSTSERDIVTKVVQNGLEGEADMQPERKQEVETRNDH